MASRITSGAMPVAVLAIAATAVVSNSALVQATPPAFTMAWTVGSADTVTYDWTQFGTLHGDGDWQVPGNAATWSGWKYTGTLVGDAGAWQFDWNTVFNVGEGVAVGVGAFVTANIVVTNNDIVNQNFSLLMTLPTGLLGLMANLTERGSVVGTITDLTFDDATVFAPVGGRIYTPMIDGSPEASGFLMVDPFSESAGGPLFSNSVGPADFGIPAAVGVSQDVDSSIGILLSFDLTPGDSASFTAIFEILIPGPAGLPLLVVAGMMAGMKRRRR